MRTRRTAVIFGGLVVALLAALYSWQRTVQTHNLPTDSALSALYEANRSAFERMKTLAMEDSSVLSLIDESRLGKSQLSEARKQEYRRLMRISPGMTIGIGPNQVTFNIAGGGIGLAIGRTWMKGITYLPNRNGYGSVRSDLNHLGFAGKDGVFIVPIDGDWYLIYSQSD